MSDCGHIRWSAQQEAVLVKIYALSGIRVDGYAGCTQCGLDKLRKTHPKLVEEVEALFSHPTPSC